jgi:hypothetical protein
VGTFTLIAAIRARRAPNRMFWEFEDGLTNTITGATESAGRI